MGSIIERAAALAAAVCLSPVVAVPAGAAGPNPPPPTLTDQSFDGAGLGIARGDCNPLTLSGRIDFAVIGTASGPYPGRFVEVGTVTATLGTGASWRSTLTIFSSTGLAVVSRRFDGRPAGGVILSCDAPGGNVQVVGMSSAPYNATIYRDGRRYTDHGFFDGTAATTARPREIVVR